MEEKIIKEKWKNMTALQKLEYIWMYYKGWFLAVIVLVAAIWLGITMYEGSHTPVLLNVAIVEGDANKAETLGKKFSEDAGIQKKDGVVRMKANIPNEDGSTSSQTVLTTLFGADAVDVLICTEEVYEQYNEQEGFINIADLLGEDWNKVACSKAQDAILLSEETSWEGEGIVSYDKIYVAVPINCQNKEMAVRFINYLFE